MRTLAIGTLFAAMTATTAVTAQRAGADPAALWHKLDAKLREPWVHNAMWITDVEAAKQRAADSGRYIFVYITRSYAP